MSEANIPPWLQEELARYDQLQQTLQALLAQKQQVDLELADAERAIEELTKENDDAQVYKISGSIMIRSTKQDLLKELGERKELANTRRTILAKQEEKVRQSLQEVQAKVNQALKGPATA
ncbi:MAG: prefoldin subunit beta [Nitrososphaerota archaeon]|jgi:prefoldin beta subunit|nr:prefoldin subunit beta [Nitrososphaerota archaeon]MDG6927336.1 prefoldin subunit beta [Nitrososphaerota archaeon]MDG6930936.1 prefoldin subunit beta [Nitrososphaerota archaeon]MDG6932236.1 prefoldin subunit beta [Nitrososphaerota archaeon]MDG6935771.1 prefoldin subunit beta [Nitrososphaerota archaeon]